MDTDTRKQSSLLSRTQGGTQIVSALFFSRGRGRGHAIPDLEIARELQGIDSGIEIQFVSYATGAETFKAEGRNVVDLGLPEDNSFVETIVLAHRTIAQLRPHVVISHEEFPALVAARLANIPSIYLAAWLPPQGSVAAESLACAGAVIVTEDPGIFPVPQSLSTRPTYTGPILRKMKYSVTDRSRLRNELGIETNALAILVAPGGGWPEEVAPISETVLPAFLALTRPAKHLFWLAGKDFDLLTKRTSGMPGVHILDYFTPIERLIVACDLVITKGTYQTTLDAASLGVPSISLSPRRNPIDDTLVPRIHNNVALSANAVDGSVLSKYIEATTRRTIATDGLTRAGAELAAASMADAIWRLVQGRAAGSTDGGSS